MDTRGRKARTARFRVLVTADDRVRDEHTQDIEQAWAKGAADHAQSTLARFAKHFKLTAREAAILDQLAQGISPKGIASGFGVSLQAIYAKLAKVSIRVGCKSYPEVIAKLFRFSCNDRDPDRDPDDSDGLPAQG